MNWSHLLIEVPVCVFICATICYLLDKRRHRKVEEDFESIAEQIANIYRFLTSITNTLRDKAK